MPTAAPATNALLDHVLRTMRITTQLCTLQHHERDYRLERRTVPDYNFIYVTRGHAVWVIEEVEHELRPHDLVIVPPGVWHHGFCRTDAITLGSLHVLVTMPGDQDVFALLAPPMRQTMRPGSRFDGYFRAFMDEFSRPERTEREQMFPGWAHLIVSELFRDNHARGLLHPRPGDPLVAAMLAELERHLDREATLDELARHAGFSPQHLNRVFTRSLGTTPLKYLAQLRMQRAAALLRDGVLTVAEIARRVGHPDPDYFSRQFSAHFGVSPSAYRRSLGSEGGSESPG